MPFKMDLTPDSLDLVLYAGDVGDFSIKFVDDGVAQAPIDVSSYVWTSQIRKSRASGNYTSLAIDTTDAATGVIVVQIPASVTRNLADNGVDTTGQWDIQCTSGGSDPVTILQGTVYCSQDVTR